jgi:hypothetical protein
VFPFLLFACCCIHKYRPLENVYFPTHESHRRISQPSFLKWFTLIWFSSMEDVLQECGADGALIFCMLEFALKFFFWVTMIGMGIIFPIHVYIGTPNSERRTKLFTIDDIPDASNLLFAHVTATWVIVILFYVLVYQAHLRVQTIKNRYMLLTGPSSRTIVVQGIPPTMTESDVHAYFASLLIGQVSKVVIVRSSPRLVRALADRWRWLQRVEQLGSDVPDLAMSLLQRTDMANEGEPGYRSTLAAQHVSVNVVPESGLDSLLTGVQVERAPKSRIQQFKADFTWAMMSPRQRLVHAVARFMDADARVRGLRAAFLVHSIPTSTAYVEFTHPTTQSIASQALVHGELGELRVERAPAPLDVMFHNLGIRPELFLFRKVIVVVSILVLIFFWAVPIGAVASLLSLETLVSVIPWLSDVLKWSPLVESFIKGVLPTLAITIFLALLPTILDILSQTRGYKSTARANMFVFTTYFYFQLFNVLLIFSIAGTIIKAFQDIIDSPRRIPEFLAESLPKVSPFFVNLILLHMFVLLPLLVLQPGKAALYLISPPRTPRDTAISERRPRWQLFEFAPTILIFVIGLVYSLVCPIILPITLAYATVAWFTWRYRLLYQVEVADTRGCVWVELVRMMHYGLNIFVLLMWGILSLKKFYWSAVLVPLMGVLALGWLWIRQTERRILQVPLDVWRAWQRDELSELKKEPGASFQGVSGIEELTESSLAFDNPLLSGKLPQPWFSDNVPEVELSSQALAVPATLTTNHTNACGLSGRN